MKKLNEWSVLSLIINVLLLNLYLGCTEIVEKTIVAGKEIDENIIGSWVSNSNNYTFYPDGTYTGNGVERDSCGEFETMHNQIFFITGDKVYSGYYRIALSPNPAIGKDVLMINIFNLNNTNRWKEYSFER